VKRRLDHCNAGSRSSGGVRIEPRKIVVAVSIFWRQYTSLNQAGNDPAPLRAHAIETVIPRGNQASRSRSGAAPGYASPPGRGRSYSHKVIVPVAGTIGALGGTTARLTEYEFPSPETITESAAGL
jgi:hypothetical protein